MQCTSGSSSTLSKIPQIQSPMRYTVTFGSIEQRIDWIFPDNFHQRDRYQVRHHDYIHDGANGILGSPQQVAFSEIWRKITFWLFYCWLDQTVLCCSIYCTKWNFRSYLCTDAGSKPMHTELHRSDGTQPQTWIWAFRFTILYFRNFYIWPWM